jgi:hypothetical protein
VQELQPEPALSTENAPEGADEEPGAAPFSFMDEDPAPAETEKTTPVTDHA